MRADRHAVDIVGHRHDSRAPVRPCDGDRRVAVWHCAKEHFGDRSAGSVGDRVKSNESPASTSLVLLQPPAAASCGPSTSTRHAPLLPWNHPHVVLGGPHLGLRRPGMGWPKRSSREGCRSEIAATSGLARGAGRARLSKQMKPFDQRRVHPNSRRLSHVGPRLGRTGRRCLSRGELVADDLDPRLP